MDDSLDLDAIEALNIKYSDNFARRLDLNELELGVPEEEIMLFKDHIPGVSMLDVGCGWAWYARRFTDEGLEYIGIDHSEEMIKAARGNNFGLQFGVMSFRKLQFPDGSFDGLWCCCAFAGEPKQNMPNVLLELKRVLTTGGILHVIMRAESSSGEELLEDSEGKPLLWSADYDQRELEQLLESVGFEVVESNDRWQNETMSVLVRKL